MIEANKEYFLSPYYFFITEKNDKISLYYSIANTLTESRKKDDVIDFDKKDLGKVKKKVPFGDINESSNVLFSIILKSTVCSLPLYKKV